MRKYLTAALLLSVATSTFVRPRNEMAGMGMVAPDGVDEDKSTRSALNSSNLHPVPHRISNHHGVPILQMHLKPEERLFWEAYNTTTFLTDDYSSKFNLYVHIATILLTTIFVYPLSMVAKNAGMPKFHVPLFFCHCILVAVSLFSLSIYGTTAPTDLYPGNAYSKMSWILVFVTAAHCISAAIYFGSSISLSTHYHKVYEADDECLPMHVISRDHSSGDSDRSSRDWEHSNTMGADDLMDERETNLRNFGIFSKFANNFIMQETISRMRIAANYIGLSNTIVFNLLHWGSFFYFLVYIPTGVATVFVLGKGKAVFNILAHFIKGGVFFSLGLLSLARYCGAFKGKGWAWNSVYSRSSSRIISMEMVESGLILFYGCTNIFLEHLANPGGEWSAKDLQHVSIAFIYIGAGFCGVITEFKLSVWRVQHGIEKLVKAQKEDTSDAKLDATEITNASPGFSPNPFPIFTIYWTGVLMSKHAQASELSTEIHSQWGNLLVYGTAFRLATYLIMIFLPKSLKNLTEPTKPITEIITSFALLCGGLIFMESCDPIILALEYKGFTPMLTLNLSLGFIALLMAWEMTLFAFKDWLEERKEKLAS
ncbi:uncharacterized membrane protein [[Candida] railenensis]|uniref:Uncharacterized membrane protein n=1 Tax=[Candida] railenensis TaxID=45579 RepID=A0A9P0QN06_9ASCO|nr:uncharacterized membrane protein [[Candida] railenensis]